MKYSRVYIEALGYELAPVVVSSEEIEERLAPLYDELHIPYGQLEALTGIYERRWWPEGFPLSDGAIAAGRKALAASGVAASELGAVLYTGVGRELFEPATACRVAGELGLGADAEIYDLSNACLGVLSGMVDVANRIELGQIRAGLVVSCETARDIVEETMARMLEKRDMAFFSRALATMTGGSGAVAVLLTDGSFASSNGRRKLLGGTIKAAAEHHGLCRWGLDPIQPGVLRQFMNTDAVAVLKHGVQLGKRTWEAFLAEQGWTREQVDEVICHQVGSTNQRTILEAIGIPEEKDFPSYAFLGNMGTVSLPITAAIAEERHFLKPGDNVALLGIGSGLNCMMLAVTW